MALLSESGYYAVYENLEGVGKAESMRLSGHSVTLGAYLDVELSQDDDGVYVAAVSSKHAGHLGTLPPRVANHLALLAQNGWSYAATISYIWYSGTTESYGAEVAVIAWEPELDGPIRAYLTGLFDRIAKGEHPTPKLTPEELAEVKATNGAWNKAKSVPWPTFKKKQHVVAYRRKRGVFDGMVNAAGEGKMGCKVGTVLFYAVVAALVVLLVMHFIG
ncbi:MAG: hypothetical protein SOV74_07775 [Coriobacteriales bacterium]|nr:hypothetical protein [Coriobacteriales bacterium]